ncbi:MAG: hypothetical protein HQK78_04285 [Desulfobacterales bacterium]|nr:hypothetical protein [Desulfobacterales bacterium]
MKRYIFYTIFFIVLFLFSNAYSERVVEKQVNKNNIIKVLSYYDDNNIMTKQEAFFSDTEIDKIVNHLNKKGQKIQVDTFFTKKFAKENGVHTNISYYDENNKKFREESFSDDIDVKKIVMIYDKEGKKVTQESFFTEKVTKEKGFDRVIANFDKGTQKIVNKDYYLNNLLIEPTNNKSEKHTEYANKSEKSITIDNKIEKPIAIDNKTEKDINLPDFINEPISESDSDIKPASGKAKININTLSQFQFNGAVTSAKENIRFLSGQMSKKQEAKYESLWSQFYDYPSPELTVYLNRFNPLLARYSTLNNAIARLALEHDEAVKEAKDASANNNDSSATIAMSAIYQKQIMLVSLMKQMEEVAGQIKSQAKPPSPHKLKAKAKERYNNAVNRLIAAEPEEGELDGCWMPDEVWEYTIAKGSELEKHNFQPYYCFKKVKKIDDELDLYFMYDFYSRPYNAGEPIGRKRLILIDKEPVVGYVNYMNRFDYYGAGRETYLVSGGFIRYQRECIVIEWGKEQGVQVMKEVKNIKNDNWSHYKMPDDFEKWSKLSLENLVSLIKEKHPQFKYSINEWMTDHNRWKKEFEESMSKELKVTKIKKTVESVKQQEKPVNKPIAPEVKKQQDELNERIKEREASIAYYKNDLARLKEELNKNPKQADFIKWRIINRESDIILEQDRIREIKTGEFIRSRTPFDDYSMAQIVVSAQKEVSSLAQANRDFKSSMKIIKKLPYEEQQQAWKTLSNTIKNGGGTDPAKMGKLKNALKDKYQGAIELDAAKAEEKMVDADDLVARAEKVKGTADTAIGTLSLVVPGGSTVDKVYRSITVSIESVTDPDASKEAGMAQAGMNILEIWAGDIAEKTGLKKWKTGISAATSGLNSAQKTYREEYEKAYEEAKKSGSANPKSTAMNIAGKKAIAQGTFTGIWNYVVEKTGDAISDSMPDPGAKGPPVFEKRQGRLYLKDSDSDSGAKGLIVEKCIQTVNSIPSILNTYIPKESEDQEIPKIDELFSQGTLSGIEYLQKAQTDNAPDILQTDMNSDLELQKIVEMKKKSQDSAKKIDDFVIPELDKKIKNEKDENKKDELKQNIGYWKQVQFTLKEHGSKNSDPVKANRTMEYLTGDSSIGKVNEDIDKIVQNLKK